MNNVSSITAARPHVQIVLNPASGRFSQAQGQRLARAYEAAGFATSFAESSPGNPFRLQAGLARVCVAAGDGTVRHVLAEIAKSPQPPMIDIYPGGTINLVARERALPKEPEAFVAAAIAAQDRRLHPVQLNDTHFMACASIGPDARAVAMVSSRLKRVIGRMAYGVAMLQAMLRWQRPKLRVRTLEGAFDCEAIYVAKGRFFAGPWSFAPKARLDDPLLHVVALKRAGRLRFMVFAVAAILGKADRLGNIICVSTTALLVECDDAHPIQADGDVVGGLPADIRLLSKHLPA